MFFLLDITVDKQLGLRCHLREEQLSYRSFWWYDMDISHPQGTWTVQVACSGTLIKSFSLGKLEVMCSSGDAWLRTKACEIVSVTQPWLFYCWVTILNIHEMLKSCVFLVLQCLPFWPETSSGELCVRVVGYESSSKPFLFKAQDNGTLLKLEELVRLTWCSLLLTLHFSSMLAWLNEIIKIKTLCLKLWVPCSSFSSVALKKLWIKFAVLLMFS